MAGKIAVSLIIGHDNDHVRILRHNGWRAKGERNLRHSSNRQKRFDETMHPILSWCNVFCLARRVLRSDTEGSARNHCNELITLK
jgi:hypothetical protein